MLTMIRTNDPTASALGLGATWHPMANGQQSAEYHAARLALCDLDFEAQAAYDMGGELAPGGLTEAQESALQWSAFWRGLQS